MLARIARETPGAGEVLCWPHHFDIACSIVLEKDRDGDALRKVPETERSEPQASEVQSARPVARGLAARGA